MSCPTCKGYRWFDDRGFLATGQPAFSFDPCPTCNPKGELEMYGNEPGDPGYRPQEDHRFKMVLRDSPPDSPSPPEPPSGTPR